MSVDPAFSNTAGGAPPARGSGRRSGHRAPGPDTDISGALAAWGSALLAWAAALGGLDRELGASGARVLGNRWLAARGAIAETRAAMDDALAAEPVPTPALSDLIARGNDIEAAAGRLAEASATFLNPNVRAAAVTDMSRTFSENLDRAGRAVSDAVLAADQAFHDAVRAAAEFVPAREGDIEGVIRSPQSPEWGAFATELYTRLLLCTGKGAAAARLERAKDISLGCAEGPLEADAKALLEYHPLQRMGYAPPVISRLQAPESEPESELVNLALPQAHFSTVYDVGRLIDRRRALEFGPVASTASGLNYKLAARLRTISTVPTASTASTVRVAVPTAPSTDGPLRARLGGETVSIAPAEFAPAQSALRWAPFAGPQPRVQAYSAATEAVITSRLAEDARQGWTQEIRPQFEALVQSGEFPVGDCSADVIVRLLVEEFGRRCDAAPPVTEADFRALAVPEFPAPDDYIVGCVARAGAPLVEARLRRSLDKSFPRVPHAALEREAWIAHAVSAVDAGRKLWGRMRAHYRADPDAFDPTGAGGVSPERRREILIRAFRRIATLAVADEPVICAGPPSLKLFAALR